MKNKIAVIGAGNVGATLALYIAQKELGDIALVDINGDLAKGKAIDIMQSGPVLGFDAKIEAGSGYEIIKDAKVVAVTAGLARKPGMDRLDLLHKNRDIIDEIAANIKKFAPDSIVIVVSNPVDVMTYRMWQKTGFPSQRVMGQAGVLDTARMMQFISEKTAINNKEIKGMVLGGHGDTMVPVFSWTRLNGVPVEEFLKAEELAAIEKRTQNGGGEIVALLKTGSAYYAPAASTVLMIEAVLKDEKRLLPVSCKPEKEYEIADVYIGLPAIIGAKGVEKILELKLNHEERKKLKDSAEIYVKSVKEL